MRTTGEATKSPLPRNAVQTRTSFKLVTPPPCHAYHIHTGVGLDGRPRGFMLDSEFERSVQIRRTFASGGIIVEARLVLITMCRMFEGAPSFAIAIPKPASGPRVCLAEGAFDGNALLCSVFTAPASCHFLVLVVRSAMAYALTRISSPTSSASSLDLTERDLMIPTYNRWSVPKQTLSARLKASWNLALLRYKSLNPYIRKLGPLVVLLILIAAVVTPVLLSVRSRKHPGLITQPSGSQVDGVNSTLWNGRAEQVKAAFIHAYGGYQGSAFPMDELLPLQNLGVNK